MAVFTVAYAWGDSKLSGTGTITPLPSGSSIPFEIRDGVLRTPNGSAGVKVTVNPAVTSYRVDFTGLRIDGDTGATISPFTIPAGAGGEVVQLNAHGALTPIKASVAKAGRIYKVDDYAGSDPTGATSSDAAVDAAIRALGTSPGIIDFGPGVYWLETPKVLDRAGQYFRAQGLGVTTIDYRGPGVGLYCWDSTVNKNGLVAPGRAGGILGGMSITGYNNNNPGATGLRIGDLLNPTVETTHISGFNEPGGIGFLGSNKYSWTEYGNFDIRVDDCTNCYVLEGDVATHPFPAAIGSKTSWSYNSFNFGFSAEANQNGVVLRNKVNLTGATWTMNFNCNPGPTNTGVAVTVGQNATDDCHIEGMLAWLGEATVPGTVSHQDMNIGANSSLRGYGSLVFHDYSNVPWRAGNAVPYRVVFAGRVNCPSLGHYSQAEIPFVTIGDPGRFGAAGDDANYVNIEEGDNGSWPRFYMRGPSSDIGFQISTKGQGSFEYNGRPVAVTAYSAPTAWNSPGVWRQTVCDGNYLYVCVADNTWKRIPLQSIP